MVELESEGTKTRSEVAAFLREFAAELDDDVVQAGDADRVDDPAGQTKRITLIVGGNSATVTVPESVDFDVAVDSRTPMLASDVKQEISFDLSWTIDDPDERTDDLIEVE